MSSNKVGSDTEKSHTYMLHTLHGQLHMDDSLTLLCLETWQHGVEESPTDGLGGLSVYVLVN